MGQSLSNNCGDLSLKEKIINEIRMLEDSQKDLNINERDKEVTKRIYILQIQLDEINECE